MKPFAPSDKVCKLCLQEKLSNLRSIFEQKEAKFLDIVSIGKKYLLTNANNLLSTDEGL